MAEMAKGDWWFKFEIPAWRNSPELRRCSLATRGFWIECIAIMKDTGMATLTGTYEDLARAVGCFPTEAESCIAELKRNKTADVTLRNDVVTVKSRKYARELKSKELTKLRVRKHRENADVTPEKRLLVKSKEKEVINKKEKEEAEEPPLLEIHTGKIIAGICHNLEVQKLSMSVQREFENEALTAFQNGFTPEKFIECHSLLRQIRPYTIKASYVTDQLPDFDKLRQKVQPVEKPKRKLARDYIAEDRKREEALAGL